MTARRTTSVSSISPESVRPAQPTRSRNSGVSDRVTRPSDERYCQIRLTCQRKHEIIARLKREHLHECAGDDDISRFERYAEVQKLIREPCGGVGGMAEHRRTQALSRQLA